MQTECETDTVTVESLVQKVRELAAASPENLYRKPNEDKPYCSYHSGLCTNGSIGCIMGQALRLLGFDDERLVRCDGHGSIKEVLGSEQIPNASDDTDRGALAWWLREVQGKQDTGFSWGQAVAEIDRITRQKPQGT